MHEECRPSNEILERNRLQVEDSKQYYEFACLVEEKDLNPDELFNFYVTMGFAKMFEVEWREGKNPANLWYTGEEVDHPPTLTEGLRHYQRYLQRLKIVFAE